MAIHRNGRADSQLIRAAAHFHVMQPKENSVSKIHIRKAQFEDLPIMQEIADSYQNLRNEI